MIIMDKTVISVLHYRVVPTLKEQTAYRKPWQTYTDTEMLILSRTHTRKQSCRNLGSIDAKTPSNSDLRTPSLFSIDTSHSMFVRPSTNFTTGTAALITGSILRTVCLKDPFLPVKGAPSQLRIYVLNNHLQLMNCNKSGTHTLMTESIIYV